jgi:Protein of unknown function (DUF3048).
MKSKKKTVTIVVLMLVMLLLAGGYMGYRYWKYEQKLAAAEKAKTEGVYDPLTGERVKKLLNRPFMVSTDNDSSEARPQSGLSKADIVYEVPIEGGGTRYEQIFYGQVPDQIGPCRSVRPYIIDLALAYKAVLVHNGQSPQAKAYLSTGVIDHISAADYYDIFKSESAVVMYSNGKDVAAKMKSEGMDGKKTVTGFKFLSDGEKVTGKSVQTISINYVSAQDKYEYDPASKLYTRYVYGEKCTDKVNGKVIKCANIIMFYENYTMYDANSGRLNIDMTQGGKAWLFTQGKVVRGKWSRADLDSPMVFKDNDGKEYKLSPGQTWLEMIDNTVRYSWK